jgi:hypothetical protein
MKSLSSRLRALIVALPLALLGATPAASAVEPSGVPTGDYALFGACPLSAPNITDCLVMQTSGGQFTIGRVTVPIDRTITIQGGLVTDPTTEALTFAPPANAPALSQTPLGVPGGLEGLISQRNLAPLSRSLFGRLRQRLNTLTATLEPVGPLQVNLINLLTEEGPTVVLPVRVKLDNVLLGNSCYIGSSSEPITIGLTDGTTSPPPPNTPISGSPGSLSFENEGEELALSGSSLVDNSFAVPGVNGCGPFGLLDGAIDHQVGLPSPAGSNTAIVDGTETLAAASAVLASEE